MSLSREKRKRTDVAPAVSEDEKSSVQDYKSEDKNELGKNRIVEEATTEATDRPDS